MGVHGLWRLSVLLEDLKAAVMPDQLRTKLHKAIAFRLEETGEPEALLRAVTHYDRAIELNPKTNGIKTRLKNLVKRLEEETTST